MKKRVLSMAVFGLALMAVIYTLLSYSVQSWLIVEMEITDESVVEVYSVPANNNFVLLNVIHHDIMDENLFFISKSGLQLFFISLNEENDGMTVLWILNFMNIKIKCLQR